MIRDGKGWVFGKKKKKYLLLRLYLKTITWAEVAFFVDESSTAKMFSGKTQRLNFKILAVCFVFVIFIRLSYGFDFCESSSGESLHLSCKPYVYVESIKHMCERNLLFYDIAG